MFQNPYTNRFFQVPNPRVPFNGDIPNGFGPGQQVYIAGRALPHVDRFRVDLFTSSGACALHINPRFPDGCVVRNTDRNGWGSEERSGPFPFTRGGNFEMVIACEPDRYRVAVNGAHVFDYAHRIPFQEVTRFGVDGEVEVHKIVFSGNSYTGDRELHNPAVPFATPIVGGAVPGRLIQIVGSTNPGTGRFQINLQDGPQIEPSNIALHFNPRWNDPHTGQAVVRTNRSNGGWGSEERQQSHFPFTRPGPFEVLILIEHNEFKIAVNGQHFASFAFRNPLHQVNHVSVVGDVQVASVRQF